MEFAAALKALMTERGVGVRALARRIPCDAALISRIARGQQVPSRQMAGRIDDELRARGRLVALLTACPQPVADDEDVDRRSFLGLGLAGGAALAAQAEELRQRLESSLAVSTTSADVAECGASLRPRLVRVCGQLAALAAIALLGVGDPGGARRYWRTAVRAADLSGDSHLRALLRGRRAVFGLYDQHPMTSVLRFADEALGAAGDRPCAGVASGYAARAQALARLGRHGEAREALTALTSTFDQLSEPTVSDRVSQWGWAETRLRWVQSDVYSLAGLQREASEAQHAALVLYPPSAYQAPAQVELHRATCLIVAGDLTEGARHAAHTLQALPAAHHKDVLVHHTAALALSRVPDRARRLPDVIQARELLALPGRRS
jgi:hypothetical protein